MTFKAYFVSCEPFISVISYFIQSTTGTQIKYTYWKDTIGNFSTGQSKVSEIVVNWHTALFGASKNPGIYLYVQIVCCGLIINLAD